MVRFSVERGHKNGVESLIVGFQRQRVEMEVKLSGNRGDLVDTHGPMSAVACGITSTLTTREQNRR